MIVGIGTDIVQIPRIERILSKYANKFINKNFHPLEIDKIESLGNQRLLACYLAKRFAAKEAVAKALGSGVGTIAFKEIAILNDKNGAPIIQIDPDKFPNYSHVQFSVSLSDDYPIAIAFVVISK